MLRHLRRLTEGLDAALQQDRLSRQALKLVQVIDLQIAFFPFPTSVQRWGMHRPQINRQAWHADFAPVSAFLLWRNFVQVEVVMQRILSKSYSFL